MGPTSGPVLSITHPVQCRVMDKRDIKNLRRWQVEAAKRAMSAGFDIVYHLRDPQLPRSADFLHPSNQRSDEYGGSPENRVRLLQRDDRGHQGGRGRHLRRRGALLRRQWRTTIKGSDNGENRAALEMVAELPDLWDINARKLRHRARQLPLREGGGARGVCPLGQAGDQRSRSSAPDASPSPDTMVRQVREGVLDLVGAARPSIADPFLPQKLQRGAYRGHSPECIGCNICSASDRIGVPIRCTQNPAMGEEWRRGWHPERIEPKASDRSVLVIGSGPAGLEAARALGQRGYKVTLAEARAELGGRVAREAALPTLAEWGRVRDWRIAQLGKLPKVEIFLDSRLDAAQIREFGADRVVLATGATWRRSGVGRSSRVPVPGHDAAARPVGRGHPRRRAARRTRRRLRRRLLLHGRRRGQRARGRRRRSHGGHPSRPDRGVVLLHRRADPDPNAAQARGRVLRDVDHAVGGDSEERRTLVHLHG